MGRALQGQGEVPRTELSSTVQVRLTLTPGGPDLASPGETVGSTDTASSQLLSTSPRDSKRVLDPGQTSCGQEPQGFPRALTREPSPGSASPPPTAGRTLASAFPSKLPSLRSHHLSPCPPQRRQGWSSRSRPENAQGAREGVLHGRYWGGDQENWSGPQREQL